MVWKAITEDALLVIVQKMVDEMDDQLREKFLRFKIPIRSIDCKRNDEYGNDHLFAIAQSGKKVLIFDDVEDEFGIAILHDDVDLDSWELCGTIEACLSKL